ncbi:alpha/beta hydrolase family protein [Phyllobacterium myrsinacearum]|uniref:Putative dienelactone hydrolase n=1 Tax=Phyllobacterium myrsinacearum TaxID=28101 RepID=A0A839E9I7_9HYPH|nr:alpha/beta hydrolase [Phyllobacterium myrsinacearum]MBA8876541.1 putative dienelactone hydrolase [Phyllobacterium myrsinacearum]
MNIPSLITLSAFLALSSVQTAPAAGVTFIDVPQDNKGPTLESAIWYPCAGNPTQVDIGFDHSTAVKDCPLLGEKLPLIVISHGVGGWYGNFHTLAEQMADAGFVVAAINHPRDGGRSKTRDPGDIASMTQRPQDMTRLIDFILTSWSDGSQIDATRIGFFGFSRGGFTGLGMIGGNPDWKKLLDNCPVYPGNRFCAQIRAGDIPPLTADPRIIAAVIADPAGGNLFTPESLGRVTVPVQIWGSEYGGDGLSPADAASVARYLASKPEYRLVPKSGHFSFLPPCSAEFAKLAADSGDTELCTDAAGFDRVAFHKQFNADVLAFFRKYLTDTKQP